MKSLLSLVLLAGASQAVQLKNRMSNAFSEFNNAAEVGVTHNCAYAIDRIKSGAANYKDLISKGQKYTDTAFPANSEMIRWADRGGSTSMANYAGSCQYKRVYDVDKNAVLLSNTVNAFDIIQGQISDCYFITATSAHASLGRVQGNWLTKSFNSAGVLAIQVWIGGVPTVITIDDYLPYYNGNLIFNRKGPEGDLWGPMIEKVWAKICGNYENINYGWQAEAFHVLTGAPAVLSTMSSVGYNVDNVWNQISTAVASKFIVGCDTNGSKYNLPASHAYTVLGTYQLKDTAGKVVARLYRVRNPWGQDVYNGPWNDNSNLWTAAYKNQVPYAMNANDGAFFISDSDFVQGFNTFQIGFVHDDWNHSYYQKRDDNGAQASYTFTTTKAQELFVLGDLYHQRMYPNGCKGQLSSMQLSVLSGASQVAATSFTDQLGFGYVRFPSLAAGTYTIKATAKYQPNAVRDYSVSVYASEKVTIKDSNGKTSDPSNAQATTVVTTTPTTTTTTTPVVTTPVVTTPVVTPVVKPVVPVTTPTTNTTTTPTTTTTTTSTVSEAALKTALADAIASDPSTLKQSTYLFLKQASGPTKANPNYYYTRLTCSITGLYIESTVSLQSYGQTCVSTESDPFKYMTDSNGLTTCQNKCVISPSTGKDSCSYLMNTSKNTAKVVLAVVTFRY